MEVTYEEHGDTKTENIDEHGDIIYKEDDCEWLSDGLDGTYEYWKHKPSGKTIVVPCYIERDWEDAEEDK